jgi:monoamine oxidase
MGQGAAVSESSRGPTRRAVLAAGSAAALASFAGCERTGALARHEGGWVGAAFDRGHLLRAGMPVTKSGAMPGAAVVRRAGVVVIGAGISGLAAARGLVKAGIDDVQVLDLEDEPGGNSRGHVMGGMRCPLGAHYLPTPSDSAVEVIELLEELGLRRTVGGRVEYDERTLCHSPQERLFIHGGWREGLLPPIEALPAAERVSTLAQYRAFGDTIDEASRGGAFSIPTARSRWSSALDALDASSFAAWLDARGLVAPALRWYLDYCCRDDYGAGSSQVSAWAGVHYFASRHGFHAPGNDDSAPGDGGEGLLTWPEGNAWLARHLAAALGERVRSGRVVLRASAGRDAVTLDAWNVGTQERERWIAAHAIFATPLFVTARVLDAPSPALVDAASRIRHAPWLVANLQLDAALDDRPGAPLSWDNVLYAGAGLGYVDDMHQSTLPFDGPTVLTAYLALGGDSDAELAANRLRLLRDDWRTWSAGIVDELAGPHPDLPNKVRRVDLMRYGHAMAIPSPGVRSSAALQALAASEGRLHFAHTDLSAYSIFEEALFHGIRAAGAAAGRPSV